MTNKMQGYFHVSVANNCLYLGFFHKPQGKMKQAALQRREKLMTTHCTNLWDFLTLDFVPSFFKNLPSIYLSELD